MALSLQNERSAGTHGSHQNYRVRYSKTPEVSLILFVVDREKCTANVRYFHSYHFHVSQSGIYSQPQFVIVYKFNDKNHQSF